MSCQRAQGFLEAKGLDVARQVDAKRERRGSEEALTLARQARRVIVAKGQKTVTFDMRAEPPDDETLLAHLLGPTGNLRAPTLRRGDTLLVGFHEETYRSVLGGG